MKKVRLTIGTAVPAFGMMVAPAALAATHPTPGTHAAPAPGTHAAPLRPWRHIRDLSPAIECRLTSSIKKVSGKAKFYGAIVYSGSCVAYQSARLSGSQTGLVERVRYYKPKGTQVRQVFLGGSISGGNTKEKVS